MWWQPACSLFGSQTRAFLAPEAGEGGLLVDCCLLHCLRFHPPFLADGRQWSCQFYEEIEGSCSKIQCKKGNFLQLVLQKKIPLYTWSSLLVRARGPLPFRGLYGAWQSWVRVSHPALELP